MSDDQQRDPKLAKLYEASRAEEPAAQTDAAIKRLAREGLRTHRSRLARYGVPALAVAASLVLGVTVLLKLEQSFDIGLATTEMRVVPEARFEMEPTDVDVPSGAGFYDLLPKSGPLPKSVPRDAPEREAVKFSEYARGFLLELPADCEDERPEQLDDQAAWKQRIQELIDAGDAMQADCLRALFNEQFGKPDEQ